jgi:hypothetical protein
MSNASLAAKFAALGPDFTGLLPNLATGRVVEAVARIAAEGAVASGRAGVGEDGAHGSTEAPDDAQGLPQLAEEPGEERGEGDRRQSQ